MEAITSGRNQLKHQFKPGDTAWIKIHYNSWWPAQIVDEKTVGHKPKKKAKDEILVRQYGTYEYLYMDPWKNSSEFEKFLKQENCDAGGAFQKSLEEDLLCLKSAGKSKRKVSKSKENFMVEALKVKKQKQDKIQRNREAIGPVSPGCPSDKLKKVRAEQGKDKSRDESQTGLKINQDNVRKPMIAEKGRAAGSKIRSTKQYNLRQPKHDNVEKQVKGNVKGEAFKDKGVEQGEVRKKNVVDKEKCGTSKMKNTNQDGSRQMKLNDVKEQVTLMVRDEALTRKNIKRYIFRNRKHKDVKNQVSIGQSKEGRQDVARKAVNGGSKVEMMKQDCLRKLKRKYDKEERTEKDGDKISKCSKKKQRKEGRSSVIENATDGVSEVKNVKQMGSGLPKHDGTKEHHIESPCSTKYGTPQETGGLSARRTRVMQSLGLIAPLGSPFRRNGLVEAAMLKL
ncbi:hepatoma-derived growth factor-related protein 2-like [Phoenix dactylifera]|uniref:Hepatoma-derived growth factor-related protein 2-like n=1 Tax=Phoenix dactylifera TaxID=42345 RepID=A0A8B9A9C4_PHODC|nr:hepatoma-derived growth factor-related protein 2-like [Phoenix dactylifera]XP_038983286.1 hepatoma-derived growth factor-related protein 2-like [Phoenix dactylifera]